MADRKVVWMVSGGKGASWSKAYAMAWAVTHPNKTVGIMTPNGCFKIVYKPNDRPQGTDPE